LTIPDNPSIIAAGKDHRINHTGCACQRTLTPPDCQRTLTTTLPRADLSSSDPHRLAP